MQSIRDPLRFPAIIKKACRRFRFALSPFDGFACNYLAMLQANLCRGLLVTVLGLCVTAVDAGQHVRITMQGTPGGSACAVGDEFVDGETAGYACTPFDWYNPYSGEDLVNYQYCRSIRLYSDTSFRLQYTSTGIRRTDGWETQYGCMSAAIDYAVITDTCNSVAEQYDPAQKACIPKLPGRNVGASCPSAGNPIALGSGNKFQTAADYPATAPGGISFYRYYNSQDYTSGGLGQSWRHGYERRLYLGSVIKAARPDGRVYTFSKTGSEWYSDSDVPDRLISTSSGWIYKPTDNSEEQYDSLGRLVSIRDAQGRSQALSYDEMGRLLHVVDAFGRTLHLTYNADNLLESVYVPGTTLPYTYQYAAGRLSRVLYPDGLEHKYGYDDARFPNALTSIRDGTGTLVAGWSYDAEGRAISSVHADGADNTQVAYNGDGTVTVTNALGKLTTYHFATISGVLKVVQVTGHPTANCVGANRSYTYDPSGFLASKTDWNGVVTAYQHDSQGREVSRTEAAGTPTARTITTEWHSQWRVPTMITEPGKVITFSYDANGQLLSRSEMPAP